MNWIITKQDESRGDIESREDFIRRNVIWWIRERHKHKRSYLGKYNNFIDFGTMRYLFDGTKSVGEVGGGPFGGIIEECKLRASHKYFIDYIMTELFDLSFIEWPEDATYIDAPAESIPLPDNEIDILISNNCLDHGWDTFQCIRECVRISKQCFLSFDCRGDNEEQIEILTAANDLDHHQLLKFADVETFVEEELSDYTVSLSNMNRKQFPVVFLSVEKL